LLSRTRRLSAISILTNVVEYLPGLFTQVLVPPAVIHELANVDSPAKVRDWIASPPNWLKIVTPRNAPDTFGLDLGETQAILLGEEYGIKSILIDERKGNRVARERGFRVVGTLAIIERFAERGWIDFEDIIARLRLTTFRYSEPLIVQIRERLTTRRQ